MQLNKVFSNWLHARKITDSVIEQFNLHTVGEKLVIPVLGPDGFFAFNKYRRSPLSEDGPKYTYDKGGKVTLFGAVQSTGVKEVLFTEGELDALVAWSHNIPAVSSTGGALSTQESWSAFFADKDVTICFDNDSAGGEGMVKALKIIPHAKIMFIPDKPGVKDISEYVTHGGDIVALLKTAKNFTCLEDVISDRAERTAKWQSTYFHDAFIKEYTKPTKPARTRDTQIGDKVARAKAYPIDELLQFNYTGNTKCLFHAEAHASLHFYKKENKCWCFGGCGRGYDSIDIYMKLHNVGFKEAVERLQ